MSGTQGRQPPAMPPQRQPQQQQQPQWPPLPPANAPQNAPATGYPLRQAATQPPLPPQGGYSEPAAAAGQPMWSPAPPAPFPSQQPAMRQPTAPPAVPQQAPQQQAYGYPPQPPAQPVRTEPPRRAPDPRQPESSSYDLGSYGLPSQHAVPPSQRDPRTLPPRMPSPPQGMPQTQPPHFDPPMPQQWAAPQTPDPFGYHSQPPPTPQQLPQHAAQQQPGIPQDVGLRGGNGPAHSQGYPQHHAAPQHASAPVQPHEQYDEVEVEEAPRPRRRWMIALALIGSIGVGSGMAYGYKMLMGPKSGAKDQVVRAPREPAKVAPSDRGGKQFANTDSQFLNRVPPEGTSAAAGGPATAATGYTDSNGVRRVPTVAVGPGGTPLPNGQPAVPGMVFVGPGTGPSSLPAAALQQPPGTLAAVPQTNPSPQRTAAAAQPATPAQTPRRPAPTPQSQPDAEPAQPPPARTAAVVPKAAPTGERPKAVGGYVAVLGFQKTQLEAMKMMADLQQKYEVLRDKKLEIVQSDQSARGLGTIYRVVVGPRGGIGPVKQVCEQLFGAGMQKQGCYPLGQ